MLEERQSEAAARREVERVTSNGTNGWAAVARVGRRFYSADAAGINALQEKGLDTDILFEREEAWLDVDGMRLRIITSGFVSDFINDLRQRAPRARLLRSELRVSQPAGSIDGYVITERFEVTRYWVLDVQRRIDLGFVPLPGTTQFVAVGRAGITATSATPTQAVANLKAREAVLIERAQQMIGVADPRSK